MSSWILQYAERTPLTPQEEKRFQSWVKQNGITDVDDPRSFYDYRGYWKDIASKGIDERKAYADGLHFPDTYKQHGHPTFSVESKYSRGPGDGGHWNGEQFIPSSGFSPDYTLERSAPDVSFVRPYLPSRPTRTVGPLDPHARMPTTEEKIVDAVQNNPYLGLIPQVAGGRALARGVTALANHAPKGALGNAVDAALAMVDLPAVGKLRGAARAEGAAEKAAVRYFEHYSPRPDLTELDPRFMGTGLSGAEKARAGRPSMMHVYREGAKPEPQFRNLTKYRVKVTGDIYDVGTDPDGIVRDVVKRMRAGKFDRSTLGDEIEKAVQKKGFTGYHNSEEYGDIYKLFGRHPVERVEGKMARKGRAQADSVLASAAAGQLGGAPSALQGPFALLTPENPAGQALSPAKNAKLRQKFERELQHRGIQYQPVKGRYQNDDGSIMDELSYLLNTDHRTAEDLGRLFKQNAVITDQGWHDLNAGTIAPITGIRPISSDAAHGFTELPGGERFTFDFGEPAKQAAPSVRATSTPAPAGEIPPQADIPRPVGTKIKQSQLDEVYDRARKVFDSKEWLEKLKAGHATPQGPRWYDTRATRQKAEDVLGDQGKQGLDELLNMMAASTAMSTPESNLRRASWWRALNNAGMLDPNELRTAKIPAPPGMGHMAQGTHQHAVADVVEKGAIDPLTNPKSAGFVQNLGMNFRPATIDTRMSQIIQDIDPKLGAMALKGAAPRSWAYGPLERAMQDAARDHASRGLLDMFDPKLDPTAIEQAAVWVGHDPSQPAASFNDVFDRLLQQSAHQWGVSPSEANRLVWKGWPFLLPPGSPLLGGR